MPSIEAAKRWTVSPDQFTVSPYVGQTVHYWPLQCEKTHDHDQPFRADICHVNDDGRVNLVIYNEVGIASRRTGVPILPVGVAKSGEASMFL